MQYVAPVAVVVLLALGAGGLFWSIQKIKAGRRQLKAADDSECATTLLISRDSQTIGWAALAVSIAFLAGAAVIGSVVKW